MVEEWKEMKKFGDWLLGHGIICAEGNGSLTRSDKIWEERVGVTLVHQAAEILMKACLIKRGGNIMNRRNKTLQFLDTFDKISFSVLLDRSKFKKFNEIRNEIYHHSFKVPWEKDTEIQDFLVEFQRLYEMGFGERLNYDKTTLREKFKEIHK